MNDVDVIIAGGGIGGLANALALALTGQRVRVLERSSEFAEVGAGLQMAPNATRILRQWGLLEKVTEAGVSPRRLVFRDAVDGSVLTSAPLGDEFTARYRAPYVVIHRNDLLTILFEACRDAGVDLVPDCAVTDVTVYPGHVEVATSGGPQRAAAAVAADGLRSALRRKFSDDEPICSGYVAYRGAFPVAQLDRQLESGQLEEVVVYIGPGRHLVQYPLRRGEIFNTVAVFASPAYRRGEAEWGGPDELDEAFGGSCEAVVRGLRSLWRDRRWPMFDRLPLNRWVDGRLALTGDAAHPMLQYLAQGACQAIEDAQCLATEAEKAGGDWPAALASYADIRFPRTSRVQQTARLWGDMWHVDGVSRLMRNELFRARADTDFSRADWLYGGLTGMSSDITELVATASRILAATGHGDLIWGHASVRDPDGRGAWLKAATWGLEEVTADRVHLVSPDGEVVAGDGPRHSEYPIHTEIMSARPDVGAVVHTHPPHAVALAATGQPLRPVSHAANYFVPPEVPRFTRTADLILTRELGQAVAAELGPSRAIFLVNHGIVTVGLDLQTATVAAVLLERACAQQMLTHAFGGWPTWSDHDESLSKRRHIYAEGPVRAVWEYLVRSLG